MKGGAFAYFFVVLGRFSSFFVVLRRVSKTTRFGSGYFCFFVP